MNIKHYIQISLVFCLCTNIYAQNPIPTKWQSQWHDMEYYMFVHFGPNTFTDLEWGHGDEDTNIFNPSDLDCEQWCSIAKESGAKGIIITAKHHDGYCLWPSKQSAHTVANSVWKNGQGDVLKELSGACKKYGLKFGVYISPWDRNHPKYGTEEYNDTFIAMMGELFDNYGPIWELWWDGANGEGPNGKKQVYDWERYKRFVKKKSPHTVIFSDVGPHVRWVGNEKGFAGTTNWNTLNIQGFSPGLNAPVPAVLNEGDRDGSHWIPGECDVSIRPGWFYHQEEDDKVKSPETLFDIYLKSVGRGANLLLNVPPDRRGKIHAQDSSALMGFKSLLDLSFRNNLFKGVDGVFTDNGQHKLTKKLTDRNIKSSLTWKIEDTKSLSIHPKEKILVNTITIQENLKQGQQVEACLIHLLGQNDIILATMPLTTIGKKRIVTFPAKEIYGIRLEILQAKSSPSISEISAFLIPTELIEK